MAFVANGPDATEKPANSQTIPARTVARNLLPALIPCLPAPDYCTSVVVNYNTKTIASAHRSGGRHVHGPGRPRAKIAVPPDAEPRTGTLARPRLKDHQRRDFMKTPVNVAITGAAGQIGYALAFRVASGQMLGADQPVNLHLLEITPALGALQGVVMELSDCAFPTLNRIVATDDGTVAFKDCHFALLVGARPRGPGMERKDLLLANAQIFSAQGKALDAVADRNVRVLVVGNPANTNSLIAQRNAPNLNPRNFTAMVRLDHNRALSQLAEKTGKHTTELRKVIIWGNHSATQYPDLHHASVAGKPALSLVDGAWYKEQFIPTVQQRGAAIIKARGASSAASAASAAIDHMHTWVKGTPEGDWVSMGVPSDGSYGIPAGVIYGYPVTCASGDYQIVQGLAVNDFSRARLDATHKELLEERDGVKDLI